MLMAGFIFRSLLTTRCHLSIRLDTFMLVIGRKVTPKNMLAQHIFQRMTERRETGFTWDNIIPELHNAKQNR